MAFIHCPITNISAYKKRGYENIIYLWRHDKSVQKYSCTVKILHARKRKLYSHLSTSLLKYSSFYHSAVLFVNQKSILSEVFHTALKQLHILLTVNIDSYTIPAAL